MDSVASVDREGSLPREKSVRTLLGYLLIISPLLLVVIFAALFVVHSVITARSTASDATLGAGPGGRPLPKRTRSAAAVQRPIVHGFSPTVKAIFKWLCVGITVVFTIDAAANIAHTIFYRHQQWWCGQATVVCPYICIFYAFPFMRCHELISRRLTETLQVYIIGFIFAYAMILISLVDTNPAPTYAHLISWSLDLPMQLAVLAGYLTLYTNPHHEPVVGDPFGGRLLKGISSWEAAEVVMIIVRILLILILVLLYAFGSTSCKANLRKEDYLVGEPTERACLLESQQNDPRANGNHCGTPPPMNGSDDDHRPAEAAWVRPSTMPSTSWWEYLSGYTLFLPYLWPARSRRLQLTVISCVVLVVLQRIVNVLVPYQIGSITDALSGDDANGFYVPWGGIMLYAFYRWLQGGQGLIGSFRSFLWIPISQYSYMQLSTAAFEHVHGLSLDFHLGKKTGEVLSALSKGSSINTFLEQVTFQVMPMLVDLGVAIGYFLIAFDVYYALVITIVTFVYLYVTIRMASWRAGIRREMVNASRQEDAVK